MKTLLAGALAVALLVSSARVVFTAAGDSIQLPNGLAITPSAAPHSVTIPIVPDVAGRRRAALGQAVTTALSPDGTQLLVLTSGYNKLGPGSAAQTSEYVLVYDVTSSAPRQVQALPLPNSFGGVAWNPNGQEFYVSGGVDDVVYVFARRGLAYYRAASVTLGHRAGNGLLSNAPVPLNRMAPKPMVAGIAVNQAGTTAVVANFYNDSISIVDLMVRRKTAELDLRPGVQDAAKAGVAGGEYPYWVAIRGDDKAFVSSPRDREVVVVRIGQSPVVTGRIAIAGQPNRILLNRKQDRLFVAVDNADSVAVVDAAADKVLGTFGIVAPAAFLPATALARGANPNSLALAPDERTLFVTDGGTNAIAVAALDVSGMGRTVGLIPTGWYPNSVSISADGKTFFVVNGKNEPGPNPGNCRGDARAPGVPDCPKLADYYVLFLQTASLMSAPVPSSVELDALTRRTVDNNRLNVVRDGTDDPVLAQVRSRIKHIIYIIKENRTYDQVLGDLEVGDGDPALTEFPEPLSPNHHALARNFVTLDNFLDSGEVSGVGWNWTTAARTTDYTEKTVPPNYAGRGFEYDWEGMNRNVNVGIGSLPERIQAQPLLSPNAQTPADANLLPGTADVAAPDSNTGEPGGGYIWDEVLRAGLSFRNYGTYCDLSRYDNPRENTGYIPSSKTPFADKIQQAVPTKRALQNTTDLYFRSFDQNFSDFYLFKEWEREFDQFVASGALPGLSMVRLAHDHFGNFGTALYGINTPAMQFADNDYAVGLLVERVAHSRYKNDTLIFIIEDDAQDGPDHVDAHRSIAYVAGPYVRQHAVVSQRYTTVSMVRTIEALLGLTPSSLYSAVTEPMAQVFDLGQADWNYTAVVPDILRTSMLPLPARTAENSLPRTPRVLAYMKDVHNGAYWQKRLGDMDYDEEDKLDTGRFNRELWKGMMGSRPYPRERSGKDLRQNRAALLGKRQFARITTMSR
jgi:DNA-binding beta-propeller fold protein YncE